MNKKHHFVGTVPRSNKKNKTKNTTLSEQFQDPIDKIKQKIPHRRNSS
jgi:hypothetical protein